MVNISQAQVHHSTLRKIIHQWNTFKTVVNLKDVAVPANLPSGQTLQFSEKLQKKKPLATALPQFEF